MMAIPFKGKQCRFPFLLQCPNSGTYQIPVCLDTTISEDPLLAMTNGQSF